MNQLISTVTKTLTWVQMPAIVIACLIACVAGYLIMSGNRGSQLGKTMLISTAIGLVIILGAGTLMKNFSQQITFLSVLGM